MHPSQNWVIIGLDNGLSLFSGKPISESMITSHKSHSKERTPIEADTQGLAPLTLSWDKNVVN